MNRECTFEKGPEYKGLTVLRAPVGFALRKDGEMQLIPIDGSEHCYSPVSAYGFDVTDFSYLPTNEYGFKTIASYWVNELMVTRSGLFVVYSQGIPSLRGLPSKIAAISGPMLNEVGNVVVPNFSLFTHREYCSYAILSLRESFNHYYNEAFALALDVRSDMFALDSKEVEVGYCNKFNPEYDASGYIYLYPKYTNTDIDRRNKLIKNGLDEFAERGNNF